jgi:multidrug efflux pump subunit AcrB
MRGEVLREKLRAAFARDLPEARFSFEAADIVSQVMSFGSPTPVEVAVLGSSLDDNVRYASKLREQLVCLSFLRDLTYAQPMDYPTLDVKIDRERAGQYGLTMADVTRSVVPATSSSRFTEPNYWRDPKSGNAFQIQVEIPQYRMQGEGEMSDLPVMREGQPEPRLGQLATFQAGTMPALVERYNGQRVVSLTANISGITLGQAAREIQSAVARAGTPPRGVSVRMRGQIPPLEETISGLRSGLALTVAVIFLVLMANFQSLRLPIAILLTVPAVLCGSVAMLAVTGTTLNVQSFLGGIMAVGISVANSILLVTFAESFRHEGMTPREAARQGAAGRLRAILMTAAAMIAGMVPMAVGFGEGSAQSAPLGRAVIGGLAVSTFATLTVLPALYAILQGRAAAVSNSLNPLDPESRYYAGH